MIFFPLNQSPIWANAEITLRCWKREILSERKNTSSNQLFSNFSSKTVASTKSFPKRVKVKFRNFHTVVLPRKLFSSNQFKVKLSKLIKRIRSRNFWNKMTVVQFFTERKISSKYLLLLWIDLTKKVYAAVNL